MSVLLPSSPGVQSAKPQLLDFGATLTPPMGGPAQRLNRLGNRYALEVTFPSMRSVDIGRVLLARLQRGLTEGVIFPFPQDFDPGAPGSFTVNGNGQTGSALNVHGGAAAYPFVEGQFFSIIYGGRRYLHCVTGDVVASSGAATLDIVPMLRISPNNGAVCEFAQPMIEGFLSGTALDWQIQTAPYNDVTVTIVEAA